MNKDLYDTVFSVIYGGIIGDALGVPYEFRRADHSKQKQ